MCIRDRSMSVQQAHTTASRTVSTLLDHFSVTAIVGSHSPVMEGLVWRIMSVHLEHTTASNAVSTLLEDSDVNATQAFNSTLIKELVLVSSSSSVSTMSSS